MPQWSVSKVHNTSFPFSAYCDIGLNALSIILYLIIILKGFFYYYGWIWMRHLFFLWISLNKILFTQINAFKFIASGERSYNQGCESLSFALANVSKWAACNKHNRLTPQEFLCTGCYDIDTPQLIKLHSVRPVNNYNKFIFCHMNFSKYVLV